MATLFRMAVSSSESREVGVPLPGQVISVALSLAAVTALSNFLTQRTLAIKIWSQLPLVVWLVFAIYIDSYVFVGATAILQHSFGVNSNLAVCRGAIILCLVCYVTTKFIYLFLVEKAHIIRGTTKSRLGSKLYIFNSFGMLGIYVVVVILNFIFRITRMDNGQCIIGMRSIAMIPLISFDAVVNVYLTIMFLIPLKNLYSFKNMPKTQANIRLRTVAFRTFVGAVCTLISSIVNLSVLMALDGEPGWVCLMCCNCDILFSAIVIQWVTSRDNAGTSSATSSGGGGGGRNGRGCHTGHNQDAEMSTIRSYATGPITQSAPPTPGEVSLVTTASCSPPGYADDDAIDEDSTSTIAKYKSGDSRAVIVTTTIRHESVPAAEADRRSRQGYFGDEAKEGVANSVSGWRRGATVWPETVSFGSHIYSSRGSVSGASVGAESSNRQLRGYYDAC